MVRSYSCNFEMNLKLFDKTMNNNIVTLINKTASFKNIVLLGMLFLITAFVIIPEARQQIKQYTGETNLIDGKFQYSTDQIYQLISVYGDKGRSLYAVVELTADLFFGIVSTVFLGAVLFWLIFQTRNTTIKIRHLLWFTVLTLIINVCENLAIVWMLLGYPKQYNFLAHTTSFLALSRWILFAVYLGLIVWNLVRFAFLKSGLFQLKPIKDSISKQL